MLKSAKSDEQEKLKKSSETRKEEVLYTMAKDRGADQRIQDIDDCRIKTEKASEELGKLGFSYEDGDLSMTWNAPLELRAAYDEALLDPQVANVKSLKKFDLAVLKVLTVETAAEAREIAESIFSQQN